jgi:hypothetical protein
MACTDCQAARETAGLWALFNPTCLHCGARLIQQIGKLPIAASEATRRRKAVLATWMEHGHPEAELRALAKSKALALALAPNAAPAS